MLKLIVDKIEDVEEGFRPLYVEKDGKWHLQVEGIEDPAPLRRNLEAARRAERAMAAKVAAWEKLGKTDEEIAALIAKAEQDALSDAEKKGEWEKLKAQMNERHGLDLQKKDKEIEAEKNKSTKLRAQIERYLVDANATGAIATARGVPDLLLPIVKRFMKVTEGEDGEFSTSIVDDKGNPRVNGKGDPLTLDELLAEMKTSEKLGRAFEASGHAGSGSQPGGGGGSKVTPAGVPKSWAEAKTPEDKAKFLAHQKASQPPKGAAA